MEATNRAKVKISPFSEINRFFPDFRSRPSASSMRTLVRRERKRNFILHLSTHVLQIHGYLCTDTCLRRQTNIRGERETALYMSVRERKEDRLQTLVYGGKDDGAGIAVSTRAGKASSRRKKT